MSDVSNYVRTSEASTRDEINKILALINPLSFPDPESTGLKERIIFAAEVRKRTTSVVVGNPNRVLSNTRKRMTALMRRKVPTSVSSYQIGRAHV